VFDWWSDRHCLTKAPASGSDRPVWSVPGPVAQDQPGPVGQICQTSWLLLWSDSARPTTSWTRLFEHRSNCCVWPVNAGSAWEDTRKLDDLWIFDAWSQILTGKTCVQKSNLGSQASIGHIYVFVSPCARVFFPEKTREK
jgi:hypothetical protein